MEKITTILNQKESYFKYISPYSTVDEALCRMNCEKTDHLVVIDEEDRFLGVITEHDIASKAVLEKMPLTKTLVKKLVNKELPIASTDDTVEQCLRRMQQYHVKLLPVFDGLRFKGVVSSDDILKQAASSRSRIFDEDETALIH